MSTVVSYHLGVATHFWSDSLGLFKKSEQFSLSDIASSMAALMLMLSVNGPLNNHQ